MNVRPIAVFTVKDNRTLEPRGCMFIGKEEGINTLCNIEKFDGDMFLEADHIVRSYHLLRQSMRTQGEEFVEAFDAVSNQIADTIYKSDNFGIENSEKIDVPRKNDDNLKGKIINLGDHTKTKQ